MTETTNDKPQIAENVLERIRKCLAMAADKRGNENEIAAAARQAEALLRKYNLEASDIIMEELKGAEGIEVRFAASPSVNGGFVKRMPTWAQHLAVVTCEFFDCHVMITSNAKFGQVLKFVGYKTDVEVCNWTFSYLMEAIKRFSHNYAQLNPNPTRLLSSSYRAGVVHGIITVLRQAKTEKEKVVSNNSSSTALVVAKRRAIEDRFGKFNYGTSKGRERDWSAYLQGEADGKTVNVKATAIRGASKTNAKQLT